MNTMLVWAVEGQSELCNPDTGLNMLHSLSYFSRHVTYSHRPSKKYFENNKHVK
jgi:uncharacterized NAD-dependent epimerase/dehydratase family protein